MKEKKKEKFKPPLWAVAEIRSYRRRRGRGYLGVSIKNNT